MLVYLHGLNSSPQSTKAQALLAHLARLPDPPRCTVPQLPEHPAQAIARVETLLAGEDPAGVTLIGSSLGGYYATWLAERHGCRAVLINPTTGPATDLRKHLGPQRNLHTGETWELTSAHLAELAAFAVERITRPDRYLLMVESGDEVLDWRLAVAFYAGAFQYVRGGGDHAFRDFENQIPVILRFAASGRTSLAGEHGLG
jgi:predicted esterase YcpF (UPF0227 family)